MIHFIGTALAVQHIVSWNSSNHSWNQQSWRELWFLPVFLLGISEIYHLISPKYNCGQWFSICYSNCLYSFYIYLYVKCFFISKMDHWHIFFLAIWSFPLLDIFSFSIHTIHLIFPVPIVSIPLENRSKFIISQLSTEVYTYSFLSLLCFSDGNATHRIFLD